MIIKNKIKYNKKNTSKYIIYYDMTYLSFIINI